MRFSIIIPVYNVEKYLKKCIDSVLRQEFHDYEVILIDDGSTDSSGNMCDDIAREKDNFKVIHQTNAGLSRARNTGVKKAEGEWLFFLDSDDFLINEHALEWIDECISSNLTDTNDAGPDMVAFESRVYAGWEFRQTVYHFNILSGSILSGEDYLWKVLDMKEPYVWMSWQFSYRREWWAENRLSFEEGILFEDVEFTFRAILNAAKLKILDKAVYAYRTNDGSITKTVNLRLVKDFICVLDKNIGYVNKRKLNPELKKKLNNHFSYSYFTAIMLAETITDKGERKNAYRIIDEKKWICRYAVKGRHVMLARLVLLAGVIPVAFLIGIRRRIKNIRYIFRKRGERL